MMRRRHRRLRQRPGATPLCCCAGESRMLVSRDNQVEPHVPPLQGRGRAKAGGHTPLGGGLAGHGWQHGCPSAPAPPAIRLLVTDIVNSGFRTQKVRSSEGSADPPRGAGQEPSGDLGPPDLPAQRGEV